MTSLFKHSLILICSLMIPVFGYGEEFECPRLPRFPSFTLSSSETCRASLQLKQAKVCLTQLQWQEWLSSQTPPEICGPILQQAGRWKLTAHLAEEELAEPKEIHPVYRLVSLPKPSGSTVPAFWQKIQKMRESLSQRLRPIDDWGAYRSMILAERDPSGPLDFLRLIGFFHLLNASGVHLYALALILGWIIARLLESAQVPVSSAIWTSRAFTLLAWTWAWILCGCRPGMLRPGIVAATRLTARSAGFRWRYWTPFVLSFALEWVSALIRHEPLLPLLNESRIEIALSVGGFLMAVQERGGLVFALLGGWIFVALAQAFRTQLVSLSAPILSLLTLPIFCTLTYPWILIESALGLSPALGNFLVSSSVWCLHRLVELTLRLPLLWITPKNALILSSILSLAILALTFRASLKLRALIIGLITSLILLTLAAKRSFDSKTQLLSSADQVRAREIIQLDVGQGDSALVLGEREGQTGLIDAGSVHSFSDAQWIRVLAHEGVSRLDWIGLTHLDEDHRGGIDRLSRLIPIRCIASAKQEVQSERGERLAKRFLVQGVRLQSWEAGCVHYPVFKPKDYSKRATPRAASGNLQMSAILVPLESGDTYLSAGDAEGEDEVTILKWAAKITPVTGKRIFKISHHGSITSSDPRALKLFHPDFSVISVGLGNTYGHPSQEVLDRLSELKIPVHRTDQNGPLRVEAFLRRQLQHHP